MSNSGQPSKGSCLHLGLGLLAILLEVFVRLLEELLKALFREVLGLATTLGLDILVLGFFLLGLGGATLALLGLDVFLFLVIRVFLLRLRSCTTSSLRLRLLVCFFIRLLFLDRLL